MISSSQWLNSDKPIKYTNSSYSSTIIMLQFNIYTCIIKNVMTN